MSWSFVSVAVAAFVGGGCTWGATQLASVAPSSSAQWLAFAAGFAAAGASAIVHLYQVPPGASPVVKGSAEAGR